MESIAKDVLLRVLVTFVTFVLVMILFGLLLNKSGHGEGCGCNKGTPGVTTTGPETAISTIKSL